MWSSLRSLENSFKSTLYTLGRFTISARTNVLVCRVKNSAKQCEPIRVTYVHIYFREPSIVFSSKIREKNMTVVVYVLWSGMYTYVAVWLCGTLRKPTTNVFIRINENIL